MPDAPETTPLSLFSAHADTDQQADSQRRRLSDALPFVSVAIPFGTPVGTYHQTVRVFEGMDTTGYNTY